MKFGEEPLPGDQWGSSRFLLGAGGGGGIETPGKGCRGINMRKCRNWIKVLIDECAV